MEKSEVALIGMRTSAELTALPFFPDVSLQITIPVGTPTDPRYVFRKKTSASIRRHFLLNALIANPPVPLIISLPHPHHDVHKRSSFFDIDCKGKCKRETFITSLRVSTECIFFSRSMHRQMTSQQFNRSTITSVATPFDDIEVLLTWKKIVV